MPEPTEPVGLVARGRAAYERAVVYADATVVGRTWQRLLEIEFVDRSVALAAKAFVSLFPLLVVVAAYAPPALGQGILESLVTRFGLEGESRELLRDAFSSPEQIKSATGIVGLLLTVLFAVSFTTALQRVYLRAWRRPPRGGIADKRRGLLWLAGTLAFLATLGAIARVFTGPAGTTLTLLLALTVSTLLWWWTARTMLRREVRWRPLLPTALLSAVGALLYSAAASVWMPRVLENNVGQFGFLGVSLSFVTWLVGFGFLLVLAAVIGPALADGDDRIGRWLRSPDGDALAPGARPALPGPATVPRLRDVLRRTSSQAELEEH